jgi:hypothetical protein
MKYWEIIADNLSKAGWSLGWVSAVDSQGQTIWIADAHRDDARRFIAHADSGVDNNAVGFFALFNNTSGNFNNAHGREALASNVDGIENEAIGDEALLSSQHDSHNTAVGDNALLNQNGGDGNTAVGRDAGNSIVNGSDNIAIGHFGGDSIVHASHVIAIGAVGVSTVFGDVSNSCYIGGTNEQNIGGAGVPHAVWVDADGTLGLMPSSRRFKHDIQPMDEILSVRYEQVNAMLLNEFLKEHKAFFKEQRTVEEQGAMIAQQQKQIDALTAGLQKVSAQLELSKAAPQTVLNRQ